MNEHNNNTEPLASDERDLLIARAAEGTAGERDWTRLEAMAKSDATVWRDVAMTRRDMAAFSVAVNDEIDSAMHVDVPAEEHMVFRLTQRSRLVATWAGWAAAAVIGLAWLGVPVVQPPTQTGTPVVQQGGLFASAAEALDAYLKRGQKDGNVVEQLPTKLLLDAKPSADGKGYDVLYLRQILERAKVPDLYKLSTDEWGQAAHTGEKVKLVTDPEQNTAY